MPPIPEYVPTYSLREVLEVLVPKRVGHVWKRFFAKGALGDREDAVATAQMHLLEWAVERGLGDHEKPLPPDLFAEAVRVLRRGIRAESKVRRGPPNPQPAGDQIDRSHPPTEALAALSPLHGESLPIGPPADRRLLRAYVIDRDGVTEAADRLGWDEGETRERTRHLRRWLGYAARNNPDFHAVLALIPDPDGD